MRIFTPEQIEKQKAYRRIYRKKHREELIAKQKAYRETHHEERIAKDKAYRETNREKERVRHKIYDKNHRKERNAYNKIYRETHKEEYNANLRAYYQRLRLDVIAHYGGKCECCGISNPEFLSIDHINNDGAKHRKEVGVGAALYRWLIKNNYPEGLQILCHNCNMAKGCYGICPHLVAISEDYSI